MNNERRGQFLQQLRKEKGITQQELGELIYYSDKAISKWELGKSLPNNPETLEKLAEIFDVSIEELLYGERKDKNNQNLISTNLTNVYKKDYKKHRKTLHSLLLISLLLIIISMLSIYLIFIKGKISYYSLSGITENFIMENSTLLLTNKVDILNFKEVVPKGNEKINYIKVYYDDDRTNQIIFKGINDNYYIEEINGYEEYNLDGITNSKLFVEINYDDNKIDIMEIQLQEKYINNTIFNKKVDKISEDDSKSVPNSFSEKIISEGFELIDNNYEKSLNKNTKIYYTEPSDIIIISNNKEYKETLNCDLEYNEIIYEKIYNSGKTENKIYNIKKNLSDFNSKDNLDDLNDYITYISYLKQLY